MKRSASVLALTLALAVTGPAWAGQEYPPDEVEGKLTVSAQSVVCGVGSIDVSGEGWVPLEPDVILRFAGQQIGTATPDTEGNWSTTVNIPEADLGTHTLEAVQEGAEPLDDPLVRATVTITCVRGVGLALTGANITVGLVILLGLVIVGSAALVAGRRRARTAEE